LPDADAPACHVCGESLGGETANCNNCHRDFHLRTREDGDGRDCGAFWINEQFLSLEYACNVCLGRHSTAEPPVASGH
jgi:hypothetical protein